MENLNRVIELHNPYALNTDGGSRVDFPKAMQPTGKTMTFECWRYSGQDFLDGAEYLCLGNYNLGMGSESSFYFRNSSDGKLRAVSGQLNRVVFDKATSEHMTYPSYSPVGSSFTIEIRFKLLDTTDWLRFAAADDSDSNGSWKITLNNDDDDVIPEIVDDSGNAVTLTTAGAGLQDATVHILSIVIDRTNDLGYAYVDGAVNRNNVDISVLTDNITIGDANSYLACLGGAGFVDIEIAEFRIWSDVRTPAEILAYAWRYLVGTESNLERYYVFDEQTGTKVTNRTTEGLENGIVSFAKTSGEHMTYPSYSPIGSDFTIELRFKLLGTVDWLAVASADTVGSNGSWRIIQNDDDDDFAIQFKDDSGNIIYPNTNNADVQDGNNHILSIVIDRGNNLCHVYVDGTINRSNIDISVLVDNITIGDASSYLACAAGAIHNDIEIAEFRIWSDVRTSTEILDNIDAGSLDGTEAGLERYYTFDDGTGAQVTDQVNGGANHGTLVNSPTWIKLSHGALVNIPTWSNVSGICIGDALTLSDVEGWHHWAFSCDHDAGDVHLYLDGKLIADEIGLARNKLCLIYPDNYFYWLSTNNHGKYGEVRFWNDVRTAAEIKANMRVQLYGNEAGLVAYYRFKDKSGTTLTDETSNNYDATITTPQWVAGCRETMGSGTWEEIQSDILIDLGISWRKGILNPSGVKALVASAGTLTFWLNNDTTNSGGKAGYYTLGHADIRDCFSINQRIRVKYTYGGSDFYKWAGRIKEIKPDAGRFGKRQTLVNCKDWIAEALSRKIALETIDTSKTADEVLNIVLDAMKSPPTYRSFNVGKSTFPYVLDTERDEATTVMTIMQKIALSERGLIYLQGDSIGRGETLVFENRHHRILQTTKDATYNTNTTATLVIDKSEYKLSEVINKIIIRVFPREVDAAATTVLGSSKNVFSVGAGESVNIILYYRDPDTGSRISGTAQEDPLVATTDYTANSNEDGSGSDLTANIATISTADKTLIVGGNAAKITITNNGASLLYVTKLQIRGKGIYRYDPAIYETEDSDSRNLYGDRELRYDMPYEDSINVAADIGDAILSERKDPFHTVEGVRFIPYIDSTMAQDFCDLKAGSRLDLTDVQSAIDDDYFIQSLQMHENLREMQIVYGVIEAGTTAYWTLDNLINSKLGTTTRLAY